MMHASNKGISLALGGGSALGIAHIGVIQVLEKNNIKINAIAGTSMGAFIGAFYCAGFSGKDLENMVLERMKKISFIFDFRGIFWFKKGFVSAKRIYKFIEKEIKYKQIKDLKLKFACTSVDLITGNEFNFEKGLVAEAVRASIAVPGIFTPVFKNDMILVDGGILNNVPIDLARKISDDSKVIAVDVLGESKMSVRSKNIISYVFDTFRVQQNKIFNLKNEKCDKLLSIKLDRHGPISFTRRAIKEMIEVGREIAEQNIAEIKNMIND